MKRPSMRAKRLVIQLDRAFYRLPQNLLRLPPFLLWFVPLLCGFVCWTWCVAIWKSRWVLVEMTLVVAALLTIRHVHFDRAIDLEIAQVAARDEPVDADGLNRLYALPPDVPDATESLIAALEALPEEFTGPSGHPVDEALVSWSRWGFEYLPGLEAGATWHPENVYRWLNEKHAAALRQFEQAALPGVAVRFPGRLTPDFYRDSSHIERLFRAIDLLTTQTHLHARRGSVDAAVQSLCTMLALGQALRYEPTSIACSRRQAIDTAVREQLQRMLYAVDFSDDHLAKLQHALAPEQFADILYRRHLATRVDHIHAIKHPGSSDWPIVSPWHELLFYPLWRHALDVDAALIQLAEPVGRTGRFNDPLAVISQAHKRADCSWIDRRVGFMEFVGMDCEWNRRQARDGRVGNEIMIVGLAVERYRLKYGQWPTKLDMLAPEFLDEVPQDVWSGKPMRFQRRRNDFTVYSVGVNGMDDGGLARYDLPFPVRPSPAELLEDTVDWPYGEFWGAAVPNALAASSFDTYQAWLTIDCQTQADRRIVVTGTTNLPPGTKLLAGIAPIITEIEWRFRQRPLDEENFYRDPPGAGVLDSDEPALAIADGAVHPAGGAVVDAAGEYQFEPVGPIASGWYAVEVVVAPDSPPGDDYVVGRRAERLHDELSLAESGKLATGKNAGLGGGRTLGVWRQFRCEDGGFQIDAPPCDVLRSTWYTDFGRTRVRQVLFAAEPARIDIRWADLNASDVDAVSGGTLLQSLADELAGDAKRLSEATIAGRPALRVDYRTVPPTEKNLARFDEPLGNVPNDNQPPPTSEPARLWLVADGRRIYQIRITSTLGPLDQPFVRRVIDSLRFDADDGTE